MASIRNLKKDINYVLGDVIDYTISIASYKNKPKEADAIVDEAIETFDSLIAKVNQRNVENKKAHFKNIVAELETKANSLLDKVNEL